MKTLAFCFRVDGKHFESILKTIGGVDFQPLSEFSSNTNPKWPVIVTRRTSFVIYTDPFKLLDGVNFIIYRAFTRKKATRRQLSLALSGFIQALVCHNTL